MKVWLDFSNSPHPLLFAPIARELLNRDHEVLVTVRDNAQTLELTRERWPDATIVGGPSPAGRRAKAAAIAHRIAELRRVAARERPDVALSHNSYAQIVAAASLRLPVVTAMDYEHQPANHLAFRLANRILLPEALPADRVRRQGAVPRKVATYPGLKEQVYVADFEFAPDVVSQLGIERRAGDVLVVLRAPPARAIYHRLENPTYAAVLDQVGRDERVQAVVLARYPEQRAEIAALELPGVVVPESAVDARSLVYAADLVVGAGGTMTREAALLGVPTVSIFAGRVAAADRWLEQRGALRILAHGEPLGPLVPRDREPASLDELRIGAVSVVGVFVEAAEAAVRTG